MRATTTTMILAMLGLLLGAPAAGGQADEAALDVLVGTIKANRKALVAVNLKLEDGEAEAFWSVYERYLKDRDVIQERLVELISDYSASFRTMSDDHATQLVEEYLAIEKDRVAVRQQHLKAFSAALPARKVMRLYQIENKIDAVLRYELAREIPVLEE